MHSHWYVNFFCRIDHSDWLTIMKAMATLQACQVIGMPECRINLAHLVAYLSEAPKSTRAYEAYKRAEEAAQKTTSLVVPMQVRNAPTRLMEEMGYGKDYRYNPDYRLVVVLFTV